MGSWKCPFCALFVTVITETDFATKATTILHGWCQDHGIVKPKALEVEAPASEPEPVLIQQGEQ